LAQLVHELGSIDRLLPALAALGGQLGDEFLGLAFVHLEHSGNLQMRARSSLHPNIAAQ
jgi:hypothetical protein